MMTTDHPAAAQPMASTAGESYVDWAAILAGAAVAAAISIVLMTFGSAIGLGITSPLPGEGVSFVWVAIAAGLWLLWVQVSSFMAGGYLAGRLRRRVGDATADEVDLRDGSHGLLVWAIGTLVGGLMLAGGVAGTTQLAVQAAGSAATTAATAADEVGDGFGGYLTDRLLRTEEPTRSQAAMRARDELGRIVSQALVTGELAAEDRAHMARVVAATTGMAPEDVEARVADVEERIATLQAEAVQAAEQARQMGVMAAFLLAATLLVSAAGAYYAAGVGGRHRDDGTIIPRWRPQS